MSSLYFKQLPVGPMANYSYLVGCTKSRECFAVDPAWDIAKIVNTAAEDEMKITGILVSHYHPDHIGGHLWGHDIAGVKELLDLNPCPVYAQNEEIRGIAQLSGISPKEITRVRSGEDLSVGMIKITCIHTPGHTPGSQCFLCSGSLVSGDTLFLSGCGRVDLPGSDPDALYFSLKDKIAQLPESTLIYPGHHYDSSSYLPLGEVKKINPYLNVPSLSAWQSMMSAR